MYLDEMRDAIEEVYEKHFHITTISKHLKRVKWTKKVYVHQIDL